MRRIGMVGAAALALGCAWPGHAIAKDLGDILLDKGVITADDLKKAREEDKQRAAADESRRDAILAKLPKWLEMITPFGDVRTRYEGFYENGYHARNRFRLRARPGLTANVNDEIGGTIRLATGDPNDPISTNQTFSNTFTHKPVNLDQAYLTIKPGKTFSLEPGWVTATVGKFGTNAYRTSELIWDDDLSPEGATETLKLWDEREGALRTVRVNAFQWVFDENADNADPWMGGGQVVAETALGSDANWTLAIGDYHFSNTSLAAAKYLNQYKDPVAKTSNPSYNSSLANSNSVVKDSSGKIVGYKSGFNIFTTSTALDFPDPFGIGIPAGLFGDVAYNTQAEGKNVGFYVGAGIGKAGKDWYHNSLKNAGDWGAAYTYAYVEKDAALSLFSYSDLDYNNRKDTQKGSTNVASNILRFDYVLLPSLQLTAKVHLTNVLDKEVSNATKLAGNPTLARTQIDAVVKF